MACEYKKYICQNITLHLCMVLHVFNYPVDAKPYMHKLYYYYFYQFIIIVTIYLKKKVHVEIKK